MLPGELYCKRMQLVCICNSDIVDIVRYKDNSIDLEISPVLSELSDISMLPYTSKVTLRLKGTIFQSSTAALLLGALHGRSARDRAI